SSRQMGSRWYVERDALIAHKKEKDAMLRAVQAESVGLRRPVSNAETIAAGQRAQQRPLEPLLAYKKEERPLFPELSDEVGLRAYKEEPPEAYEREASESPEPEASKIAIRVLEEKKTQPTRSGELFPNTARKSVATSGKSIFNSIFPRLAFSIV